jgi:SAM-dependent methyltransferase
LSVEELHVKLRGHLDEQSKNWQSFIYAQEKGFYQGFDAIKLVGCRPTEKRFDRYKIEKYLTKDKTALDIGSNCGFFSLHMSKFVGHIDGVEINPHLVAIANDTRDFLKIKNATFHNIEFERFNLQNKYDLVLSFANDSTIDDNTKITFEEYIKKIVSHLKKDGILLFESQAIDAVVPGTFEIKRKILRSFFRIVEDRMVDSEYPLNVPQRIFLVLQKLG